MVEVLALKILSSICSMKKPEVGEVWFRKDDWEHTIIGWAARAYHEDYNKIIISEIIGDYHISFLDCSGRTDTMSIVSLMAAYESLSNV